MSLYCQAWFAKNNQYPNPKPVFQSTLCTLLATPSMSALGILKLIRWKLRRSARVWQEASQINTWTAMVHTFTSTRPFWLNNIYLISLNAYETINS